MPRFKYLDRNFWSALSLGALALAVNVASYLLWPEKLIPLGTLFLFMSAISLGTVGALVSGLMALMPEVLSRGDWPSAGHQWITLFFIAYTAQRTRLPAYFAVLASWGVFLFTVTVAFPAGEVVAALDASDTLFRNATTQIVFAMIGGTLLLNPSIWTALSRRARPVSALEVVLHVVPLLTTMTTLSSICLLRGDGFVSLDPQSFVIFVFVAVVLPAGLSWSLSRKLKDLSQDLLPSGLMPHARQHGFSGLSSEFWRRKSVSDLSSPLFDGRASSANLQLKKQGISASLTPEHGICALNRNGTITFVNRRFVALADVTMRDVIGKNIDAIGIESSLSQHILKLVERTALGGPKVTELRLGKSSDKVRFLEISSRRPDPLDNSSLSDGPDSVIVMMRDITDRRTVESRLLQAQKLDSLGTVVSGIAHAFNNALTLITGQASMAKATCESAQVTTALGEILQSTQRAGSLVRQLLDFAEGRPGSTRCDLSSLIEERLELLRKMVGERFELRFEKPDREVPVNCDASLLTQALTNLVLNARESYGDRAGEITVTLELEQLDDDVTDVYAGARPGEFARLRVRDRGCGMSTEILAHAFDPLFTTKVSSGHTGLGLSIVFAVVRAHDGFLCAESKPERGTTISLYFPLQAEQTIGTTPRTKSEDARNTEREPAATASANARILVVEDEETIRDVISSMLVTLGYQVRSAVNGPEALKVCADSKFDLVLVDMIMPQMGGGQFITELRQLDDRARTLVMTGYGLSSDESPDTHFIAKPFDLEALSEAVKKALTDGEQRSTATPSPDQFVM